MYVSAQPPDDSGWATGVERAIDHASDVGDIMLAKRRFPRGERFGDLGVSVVGEPLHVDSIDPVGPAATSGLVVGDIVSSIDGVNVVGATPGAASSLLYVSPGTAVQLGLARGATVTIVAAPR